MVSHVYILVSLKAYKRRVFVEDFHSLLQTPMLHQQNPNWNQETFVQIHSKMKLILFTTIFSLAFISMSYGCSIDGRRGKVIPKESFLLNGKCKPKNMLPGVACTCYVLWANGQLTPLLASLCRRLFSAHPSTLWKQCPSRFILRGHALGPDHEANLKCLRVSWLVRYIVTISQCFVQRPPLRISKTNDRVQAQAQKYQFEDNDTLLLQEGIRQIEEDFDPNGFEAATKCLKCLRCIQIGNCIHAKAWSRLSHSS